MTQHDIHQWLEQGFFPDEGPRKLIETHISWVFLTAHCAWKIKKPLQFSFLDFSTPEKRRQCCEQEVVLNRRLTDIYLDVVEVRRDASGAIGIGIDGECIDYAVHMRRLDPSRHMPLMLEHQKVTSAHIEAIALMLADFHRQVPVVTNAATPEALLADFADLRSVAPFLAQYLSVDFPARIEQWIATAERMLQQYRPRFEERRLQGLVRDGHGDLHSGNIFLLEKPVIFDCIEFNEHLRHNDVLSELAFLYMDLEFHGHPGLAAVLKNTYIHHFPCIEHPDDEAVFQFYLLYRATVRLKVCALRLQEELADEAPTEFEMSTVIKYDVQCSMYNRELMYNVQ